MLGFRTWRGGWEIWRRRTATPSSTCTTARCTTVRFATGGQEDAAALVSRGGAGGESLEAEVHPEPEAHEPRVDPAHPRAVVLCEPSGPSAESGPSVEPDDGCTVHLVGLGRAIIDPRDGALKAVGGACTFGTTVEMLLLEMQVPYVLHASGPGREGGVVRGYVREGVHPCFVRGRGRVDAGDGGHRGEGAG